MVTQIQFDIQRQPNDISCGPTCLHALYSFYGDPVLLSQVIEEVPQVEGGGTLAVYLGCHALRRGYRATLFPFNLNIFDPTWFGPEAPPMRERLRLQIEAKPIPKLQLACRAYLDFLDLGGSLQMADLDEELLLRYLRCETPILVGLSATYLYQEAREIGPPFRHDDVAGVPAGHFVVLTGLDPQRRTARLADPLDPNPISPERRVYDIRVNRLFCAILLGIITYDGNLLIIQPGEDRQRSRRAERHRGQ